MRILGAMLVGLLLLGGGARAAADEEGSGAGAQRGIERPADLTPEVARKRLALLKQRAGEIYDTAGRRPGSVDVCHVCHGDGKLPVYERQARVDREGRTTYVTVLTGYRTCSECAGQPFRLNNYWARAAHQLWSPARQAVVPPHQDDGSYSRESDVPLPPALPFDVEALKNLKWPRFFDATHAVVWIRGGRSQPYVPIRFVWSQMEGREPTWFLYDPAYDGPWPELPGSKTATPAAPVEDEVPVEAYVVEDFDRFTGVHRVEVVSGPFTAAHKDDPTKKATLRTAWEAFVTPGAPVVQTLRIESRDAVPRWGPKTPVYLLVDGARQRRDVDAHPRGDPPSVREVLEWAPEAGQPDAMAAATKVEVRAGDWQFEVPADFRSRLKQGIAALGREPKAGTSKPAAPEEPLPPDVLRDSYDRFTGTREVTLGPLLVQAFRRDDPESPVVLLFTWVSTREEGKPASHVLRIASVRRATRLWTDATPVHALLGTTRVAASAASKFAKEGDADFEVLSFSPDPKWLPAFHDAARVEMRVGDLEFEVPAAARTRLKTALEGVR